MADSLVVISEFISEIQATDDSEEDQTVGIIPSDLVNYSCKPTTKKLSFCFSLARKTRATPSSDGSLPFVKQFILCILSTSSVHILPIQISTQVSPLKTTLQNQRTDRGRSWKISSKLPDLTVTISQAIFTCSLAFFPIFDLSCQSNELVKFAWIL